MNRIIAAISRIEKQMDGVAEESRRSLNGKLDLGMDEFCKFQELKSASMGGKLTLDEAETVYGYLGNSPATFNAQSLAVKVVLTKVFAELMGVKL